MGKKAEQDDAFRVIRGGSWSNSQEDALVTDRYGSRPGKRYDNLGVRLVRRRSALERLAESLREEVSDE